MMDALLRQPVIGSKLSGANSYMRFVLDISFRKAKGIGSRVTEHLYQTICSIYQPHPEKVHIHSGDSQHHRKKLTLFRNRFKSKKWSESSLVRWLSFAAKKCSRNEEPCPKWRGLRIN